MFRARSIQSSLSIKDKILSLDYILIFSIFILGLVSILAMYSTDGGEFKYHTKSHILRFFIFFGMFLLLSFIQIRFWHSQSYLIYIIFFPYFMSMGVASMIEVLKREFRLGKIFSEKLKTIRTR